MKMSNKGTDNANMPEEREEQNASDDSSSQWEPFDFENYSKKNKKSFDFGARASERESFDFETYARDKGPFSIEKEPSNAKPAPERSEAADRKGKSNRPVKTAKRTSSHDDDTPSEPDAGKTPDIEPLPALAETSEPNSEPAGEDSPRISVPFRDSAPAVGSAAWQRERAYGAISETSGWTASGNLSDEPAAESAWQSTKQNAWQDPHLDSRPAAGDSTREAPPENTERNGWRSGTTIAWPDTQRATWPDTGIDTWQDEGRDTWRDSTNADQRGPAHDSWQDAENAIDNASQNAPDESGPVYRPFEAKRFGHVVVHEPGNWAFEDPQRHPPLSGPLTQDSQPRRSKSSSSSASRPRGNSTPHRKKAVSARMPLSERGTAHNSSPDNADEQGKHLRDKPRYVPSLDGLRSFAVIAVILYHMGLGWAPGGLMGVTVFFVISGYLINGLLVSEHERTGSISLKSFWMRRVRRLLPAILLSVVSIAALCTLFNHVLLDKMRPDILPSLLFYNNWWQIFRDISYFEAAGSPSPLAHFWSLSIEEQFYVVWPLLLLLMYRLGLGKKGISRIALALAVFSAVEMALLYNPMGDPSRIYYGTDTRAMSLLVGVWLAVVWPSAAFGGNAAASEHSAKTSQVLSVLGIVALVGLVAIVVFTNGFSSFPYYGGIALTTVLSAVLIAALVVPETLVARLFALKPLVWIGKRSYGMYLWHFPILLLTTDPNSTQGVPWWIRLVQVALIVAVSALSYKFVEDPIRKGKIGEWLNARKAKQTKQNGSKSINVRESSPARVIIPAVVFFALLGTALYGIIAVPPTNYAAQLAGTTGQAAAQSEAAVSTTSAVSSTAAASASATASTGTSTSTQENSESSSSTSSEANTYEAAINTEHLNSAGELIYEPLLIGDSVAAGAEDAFYQVFPYGHIDAVVNRNIWESPYANYLDNGQVGNFIILCLGTNNAVVDWQIDDELLAPIDTSKKVFLVNTRNTRDWMEGTNRELERAAERHSNVVLVDWYGASAGHDEYFAGDGTHLTEEGARAYIQLIKEAIEKSFE